MKKSKPRRFRRSSGPRPKPTFDQVNQLKGNQYSESTEQFGIAFETYNTIEDHMISVAELVEKFYRIILPEKGVKGSSIVHPTLMKLMDDPHIGIVQKEWFVIFRANFYVVIRQTTAGKHGPHSVELYFKSFTTNKAHWIATLQLIAFFFNEKEMKTALLKAIEEKEWFYPESDANRSIIP